MNLIRTVLVLALLTLVPYRFPAEAKELNHLKPYDSGNRIMAVEELAAEFHAESGVITVNAKIRNTSRQVVQGYATIYLLSAEGQPLFSFQEDVNGGNSFPHGSTVDFSASARVGDLNRVRTISVDFTKR
jgi:hypothetical protein